MLTIFLIIFSLFSTFNYFQDRPLYDSNKAREAMLNKTRGPMLNKISYIEELTNGEKKEIKELRLKIQDLEEGITAQINKFMKCLKT